MADQVKQRCEARSYDRWSIGGRRCSKPAKVQEDGKWFCAVHSPAAVAKRRAARDKRWDEENAERHQAWIRSQERERRADLFPELLEALKTAAASQNCTCKLLRLVGDTLPCGKCQLESVIRKAEDRSPVQKAGGLV